MRQGGERLPGTEALHRASGRAARSIGISRANLSQSWARPPATKSSYTVKRERATLVADTAATFHYISIPIAPARRFIMAVSLTSHAAEHLTCRAFSAIFASVAICALPVATIISVVITVPLRVRRRCGKYESSNKPDASHCEPP